MAIPKIDEKVSVFPSIPNGLPNGSADTVQDEKPEQGAVQPFFEEAVTLNELRKHGGGK